MQNSRTSFSTKFKRAANSAVVRRNLTSAFVWVLSLTTFFLSCADVFAQGFGGRFRPLAGLRDVQPAARQTWNNNTGVVQNVAPPTVAPQTTVQQSNAVQNAGRQDASAQSALPQNGYIPLSESDANSRLNASARNSASLNSSSPANQNNSASSRGVVRGRGIDAAIAPKSEPEPEAFATSSRAALPAQSGSTETPGVASAAAEKSLPTLLREEGRLEFIQTVKGEDLDDFLRESKGLCVVVPHRNFALPASEPTKVPRKDSGAVNAASDGLASEQSSSEGADVEDVALSAADDKDSSAALTPDSPFFDDYVVFTLTNLDEQEELLLADSHDGRWDDFDLLNAALIAEGLTSVESRLHYRSRFESLVASLLQQTNNMQDQLQKTERIYNFLHSRALYSKYDLTCSSVAVALDSGVFNCVSATVLFNCLASRAGLRVAALETTGHAKSRVKFENSFLDIETTCSTWNRLPDRMRPYQQSRVPTNEAIAGSNLNGQNNDSGSVDRRVAASRKNHEDNVSLNLVGAKSSAEEKAENVAGEGSTTFSIDEEAPLGYSFTRSRRPMREITDVELVATIYYNVGVDHSQAGDYEQSIASYIKAVQLAPDNKTILGNLKATLNNWAIDVAMKDKDYETAILITELGQRIDPDFREFKMNLPIFFHDWIDHLAKENDWEEVKRAQDEYWKRFPK